MAKRRAVNDPPPTAEEVAADAAEVTAEEKAVADAAVAVAKAKADVAAAEVVQAEAVAVHAAAVKALEPVPEVGKHIFVDAGGSGDYSLMDAPAGWEPERPRRLTVNGVNVEHVDDDPSGVWRYRKM